MMNKKKNKKKIDNILAFMKKNARIIIPCFIGLVVIVIGIILITRPSSHETNQRELEETLKEMGADFYENYYYNLTSKGELASLTESGLFINIDNLRNHINKVNEKKIDTLVNSETKEKCDMEQTKVAIYPKDPFGLKDYEVKVILICGFNTIEELKLEAQEKGIPDYEKMSKKELEEVLELYRLKEEAKAKNIDNYENMSLKDLKKALKK